MWDMIFFCFVGNLKMTYNYKNVDFDLTRHDGAQIELL